jgi:hypothetical protein
LVTSVNQTISQILLINVIPWPLTGEQLKLSSGFALEGKLNGGDKEESACEASPDAADSDQRWIKQPISSFFFLVSYDSHACLS